MTEIVGDLRRCRPQSGRGGGREAITSNKLWRGGEVKKLKANCFRFMYNDALLMRPAMESKEKQMGPNAWEAIETMFGVDAGIISVTSTTICWMYCFTKS